MEDVINKIIELDECARKKIKIIEEKENNIETYINEKLKVEKEKIDNIIAYKKKNRQEKYEQEFTKRKELIDEYKQKQIIELQNKYEKEKQEIVKKIVNNIINEIKIK